jgi:hypothetical protein
MTLKSNAKWRVEVMRFDAVGWRYGHIWRVAANNENASPHLMGRRAVESCSGRSDG